jgi:hypothetical protein
MTMWVGILMMALTAGSARASEGDERVFGGGNNYQGGTVTSAAPQCTGSCAAEADQHVSIYSLHDIAKDVGEFQNIPLEVRKTIRERVFGTRLLSTVEDETEPGERFASYYSQIAISKVQVQATSDVPTCEHDDGLSDPSVIPHNHAGRDTDCVVLSGIDLNDEEELSSSPISHRRTASLCTGNVTDAVRHCQRVSWRGRDIGVAPYMDVTATGAPDDDEVSMANANSVRSRRSHFNEASLMWDAAQNKLVRDTSDDTFCQYMQEGASVDFDCDGKHFCPPDTDTATEGVGESFMERCFNYRMAGPSSNYFSMAAETGIPPPGDWNRVGWDYENALVDTHACDPGDALSENILFAVTDADHLVCLYSAYDKGPDGEGAKITVATPASGEATEIYQQFAMFYAPVHLFVEDDSVVFQYTIRATLPMFWGLLAGVMDSTYGLPPDITFAFKDEGMHVNLAYVWDKNANSGIGGWVPPTPSDEDGSGGIVSPGEPTTYVIGTIMNLRYHGVVFDCVDDDAPCQAGAVPAVSSQGITNLEERAFKFTTRLTIDRTTVGGLIDAETAISGAALVISLNNQACFKHDLNAEPDLIFTVSFSGLEEPFIITVQSIEYYHTVHGRVVFPADEDACVMRLGDTPGPACYDVVAAVASRAPTRYAATAAVKLPMDGCTDDYGGDTYDCIHKLESWLHDTTDTAHERKIFVTYTMAFSDGTAPAQGFLRRQEINCDNNGIYCNGLIRSDAAENLRQCEETTAVGTEITINQFTDLVSASIAVVGQPHFNALETRPPCIALDAASGDETVTCPAMLHDQCDGNKGVASVQHIMESCGGTYSMPNLEASNAIVTGSGTSATCVPSNTNYAERTRIVTPADTTWDSGGLSSSPHADCGQLVVYGTNYANGGNYPFANNAEAKAYCESFYMDMNNRPGSPNDVFTNSFRPCAFVGDNGQDGVGRCRWASNSACGCGEAGQECQLVQGTGLTTAGGAIASDVQVTAGSPVPVLGNGLGFMHLGAVAGPATQPTTKMQAARQLIFPIGARLTAKCGDTEQLSTVLFGGIETGSNDWLLTDTQWQVALGMPAERYDDMKALMEDPETLALIDGFLKGVDEDTLLTQSKVALDSPAAHKVTQAYASMASCDKNTIKPFSFLDSTRADDFCSWAHDESSNPYSNTCSSFAELAGGVDVQGFLAASGAGIVHGAPDATECNNGPAMVLGFNDQSPQWNAYPDSLEEPDQVPPCAPESGEDRGARVQEAWRTSTTCEGLGMDDVCSNSRGYRGCALQPMERDLFTQLGTSPSFFAKFKNEYTNDGRPSAAVMSALGVNINTAYLSQCGAQPTEWILETQFAHLDGLTPIKTPSCGARGLARGLGDLIGCTSAVLEHWCEGAFEETAPFTYTECVWDSDAGVCSAGSNTCEAETVRTTGVPYCAADVWQAERHLGAQSHGYVRPFCYCRDDQYGVNHNNGQQSRCVAGEKPAIVNGATFLPAALDDGRAPPECVYEGRGADLLDVTTIRTRKVDTCDEITDEDECVDAYVKHGRHICHYHSSSCSQHFSRTCEMRTYPTALCETASGKSRLTKVNNCNDASGEIFQCHEFYQANLQICEPSADGTTCIASAEVCTADPYALPQEGQRRRLTLSSVAQRYHIAAAGSGPSDEHETGPGAGRALQETNATYFPPTISRDGSTGPNGTYGSLATVRSSGVALPCSDATIGVTGVFDQACLCNPHKSGSTQCSLEFVEGTPPPPPPPPPPSDDTQGIAVFGIVIVLVLMASEFRKQREDVATVINLQQSLLHSRSTPGNSARRASQDKFNGNSCTNGPIRRP